MSDLESGGLFDGSQRPGVYQLVAPAQWLVGALEDAGWSCRVLDPVSDLHSFYTQTAERMGFSSTFGANLDALWDALTDLEEPTALVLLEWTRFATEEPAQWERVLEVLTERTESPPPFAVILA
ncbi:MAG TPA: barstar family protein [Propionibacteriaceae bacterium]|nr:barstar family protein [Propionibacteriaceae bacterium]